MIRAGGLARYDVCLTRRRSPVQIWAGPFFSVTLTHEKEIIIHIGCFFHRFLETNLFLVLIRLQFEFVVQNRELNVLY